MMVAIKNKKNERIDLRVTSEEKEKIMRAISFLNERLSDFILKRIMPDVDRLIAKEEDILLNQKSWEGFVQLLNTPKPASQSLKSAMKEYRKIQGN